MRLAGIAAVLAVTAALAPVGSSAGRPPARLQVATDEFHLVLSRLSLRAGKTIIELVNIGEDDHDLALKRLGGTRTYRIRVVHPNGIARLEKRLLPGRFVLWCTLADHRARGMHATLRVVSNPRR